MRIPKPAVFLLEGLNGLATTYHFFYIYFFAEAQFGFDKKQNLMLAAAMGLVYAAASVWGGRLAQRQGYLNALGIGAAAMLASQLVAAGVDSLSFQAVALAVGIVGMGMTWPALQALASDGETGPRLQRMVGIYNLVWSFAGAFAYLTGGAMIESLGLRSIFAVPAVMNVLLLMVVLGLRSRAAGAPVAADGSAGAVAAAAASPTPTPAPPATGQARAFLRMAWFANPFAYLTINTVVAFGPAIAKELALSPRYAGYYCSAWMFVRSAAFLLLWLWPGWHYRFRWLLTSYLGMIATFTLILIAPTVTALVLAQVGFGICVGLIYYSSLYYSMDVGEEKGEHGGIHEAAIGLGCAAGPALGATVIHFAPHLQHGTARVVGAVLAVGFVGLLWLRRAGNKP